MQNDLSVVVESVFESKFTVYIRLHRHVFGPNNKSKFHHKVKMCLCLLKVSSDADKQTLSDRIDKKAFIGK